MSDVLDGALDYASRGWFVFPAHGIVGGKCSCRRVDCSSPGKHPLTPRGLKDASTDVDVIRSWWTRWPFANVAVVTGRVSGIVVIDIDLPTANRSIPRLIDRLPRTLTALTGGGGVHLFYSCDRSLRNTCSRLPGLSGALPGVDLRADGGYVVGPPSIHFSANSYEWLDAARPAVSLPAWLRETPRPRFRPPAEPPRYTDDGTAYGLKTLESALASLRSAPVGQRNHTLYRQAFKLACLVGAGHLRESPARQGLWATAMAIGLTRRETYLTIESAFRTSS